MRGMSDEPREDARLLGCRCLGCSAPRGGVRARLGAEDAIRSGSVNAYAAAAGWVSRRGGLLSRQ